jgi:hypothetical protein
MLKIPKMKIQTLSLEAKVDGILERFHVSGIPDSMKNLQKLMVVNKEDSEKVDSESEDSENEDSENDDSENDNSENEDLSSFYNDEILQMFHVEMFPSDQLPTGAKETEVQESGTQGHPNFPDVNVMASKARIKVEVDLKSFKEKCFAFAGPELKMICKNLCRSAGI